jgi:hypothetical protein
MVAVLLNASGEIYCYSLIKALERLLVHKCLFAEAFESSY